MKIGDKVIYIKDSEIRRGIIVDTFNKDRQSIVDPDTMEISFIAFNSDLVWVDNFEHDFILRAELMDAVSVLNALIGMSEEDLC